MKDRVAFVTGASQGIGRACASALAEAGARVVVGARQQDKLHELVEGIRSQGGRADAVPPDIASAESIAVCSMSTTNHRNSDVAIISAIWGKANDTHEPMVNSQS